MSNLLELKHGMGGDFPTKDEYAWVLELAADCQDVFERHGKASAQARILEKSHLSDLRQALSNGDGVIRRKTLQLLSVMGPREALEDVSKILAYDPCPVVRHEAAFFLGALGVKEAVHPLCQAMLHDKEDLVRHEAAEALGDLGYKSALPALIEATRDQSSVVRDTANLAILQLNKG